MGQQPRCARLSITLRLMSFRTWKSPYHLFMLLISMATSVSETCIFLALASDIDLAPVASVELTLEIHGIAGHGETEDEEHEADEYGQVPR